MFPILNKLVDASKSLTTTSRFSPNVWRLAVALATIVLASCAPLNKAGEWIDPGVGELGEESRTVFDWPEWPGVIKRLF